MAFTDSSALKSARLHAHIIEAKDVQPSDVGGKADPYCVLYLLGINDSDKLQKTEVKAATLDPKWDERFVWNSDNLEPFVVRTDDQLELFGYLVIDVWDKDVGNPDDFLGRVLIPFREVSTDSQTPKDTWYDLTRRSSKDSVRGQLCVRVELEVDSAVTIHWGSLNQSLYRRCQTIGFHLPVYNEKTLVELPGRTEHVELAFSGVFVDICAHHFIAQVFLTNYRLVILASRSGRGQRGQNMWIALNNIMSVDLGNETIVVCKQRSGARERSKTVSLSIQCFDTRTVKLIFVLEEEIRSRSKSPEVAPILDLADPPAPAVLKEKLLKQKPVTLTSSPKVSPKLPKSQSERKLVGKKTGSDLSDLSRSHNLGAAGVFDTDEAFRARSRSGAFCERPSLKAVEEEEKEDDSEENSELDYVVVSDNEEISFSFTDLIDGIGSDDMLDMEGVASDSAPKEQSDDGRKGRSYSRLLHATDLLVTTFQQKLDHVIMNTADYPPALTFVKLQPGYLQLTGWDVYSFPREMDRQGLCEDRWKLTVSNGPEYNLCPTYPQLMYIPKGVKEAVLIECAKFRSKGRIPALVWVDKTHHNFMLRCAQPFTGKTGKHSAFDEHLVQSAIHMGPTDAHMIIYDARSFSAAAGNKIMGKGTEIITHYPRARLAFLDIPNIHAVRESYDALRTLCLSTTNSKWFSSLESTQWLSYVSIIVKGAAMIARYMKYRHGNTLIHCSDGWDRTSQLTSLAQLLMDPYYRTMVGFQVLVDKEWLSFGHKFQHRLGHPDYPNERSPVFLQFLDCVYQILTQFPSAFEFNRSYLLCIADHLNTGWFGTFLCNCDKERHDMSLYARTTSLWAHLSAIRESLVNHSYVETADPIYPTHNVRRLRLWDEYFLRYDSTTYSRPERGLEPAGSAAHDDNKPPLTPGALGSNWQEDTVVWVSDEMTNECQYCQQKFSAFRRKHHCRSCGHIFCNDCSKHKVPIPHLGYSIPQRVCDECYRKLHDGHKTMDVGDGFLLVTANQ